MKNGKNIYMMFTDGSKIHTQTSVGAALFCSQLHKLSQQFSVSKLASIFTAECVAINKALDIAPIHQHCNFLIFTDSLLILQSLKYPKFDIKIK